MRILYVTNGFPYPLTSGYLRHYHLIRELSAEHRVTLLALASRAHRPEDRDALRAWTEHVEAFPPTGATGARRLGRRIRVVLQGDAARPPVASLARTAAGLHAHEPFDVLLLSGKTTSPVIDALPGLPLVADLCDATSTRLELERRYARPTDRLGLLLRAGAVRRVERRLVRTARHLLFASARDRELVLGSIGGAHPPASVVPNGVDIDTWRRNAPELGVDRVVFTGAMHYGPNVDAAIQLIREIHPRVRAKVPAAELQIVGRDPAPRLVAAAVGQPGVVVTGAVPDIRPYLESAAVFAAPLRAAAGIQNKLLEALAMEVPVVASRVAADGLKTDNGEAPMTVVDGSDETAEAIVRALARVREDRTPHADGREYVSRHFSWPESGARLSAIVYEVTSINRSARATGGSDA